ncbi:GNAT family N-acetyltransferase [Bacillus atrophaeus]|uniref:GNAT family N-acetyltransferase n=2 Tax=Bacillus atrophaeus TaxID=1452 RepID=UPI001171A992|nr:GNAT family N-acetyltransferase [Bacillus atrophaeus]MCY8836878.1 GNAT family N-acetyltransferase [Bacillus atrophaeus]MEC5220741.1 GNAT family N-acetyltransferase [Bacillus atrophaeus]MED4580179.1 GNAT family N-acetyltransferase [Bacillus atrophaeus]MED4721429.1 GNAT family N-acetyltransferase [Bacillus atrophaeus]MED4806783.1 GNAT family N-acetyltransferase [Bacillus atrophaeus]
MNEAKCQSNQYPFMDLLVKRGKNDRSFIFEMHKGLTKAYFKKHFCFLGIQNGEIVVAALLKHRDKPDISLIDYIAAGGIKIIKMGGFLVLNMLTVTNEAEKSYKSLKEPAWYLEVLGVLPSYQGKSLGSKMINDCLIPFISKSRGGVLALFTNTDLNRSFYRKNGFEEFSESRIRRFNYEICNWGFKRKVLFKTYN